MKHFKELVIRLQTLNIDYNAGINDAYRLVSENPLTSTSVSVEFAILKQKAIIDITTLEKSQILALLRNLYGLQTRLDIFWDRFNTNIAVPGLDDWNRYYESLMLDQIFFIHKPTVKKKVDVDYAFFSDLRAIIQWREELLLDFIEEIENFIAIEEYEEVEVEDIPESSHAVSSIPLFSVAHQQQIFDALLDFFVPEDRDELKEIIFEQIAPSEKLMFIGNGNQLADAFKQLIEANLITGCSKRQLEKWITETFEYQYKNSVRSFTPRYLNGIISSESRLCQSPILDVRKKDDHLTVIPLLRNKKQKNR
jgi:hypothetical protein